MEEETDGKRQPTGLTEGVWILCVTSKNQGNG